MTSMNRMVLLGFNSGLLTHAVRAATYRRWRVTCAMADAVAGARSVPGMVTCDTARWAFMQRMVLNGRTVEPPAAPRSARALPRRAADNAFALAPCPAAAVLCSPLFAAATATCSLISAHRCRLLLQQQCSTSVCDMKDRSVAGGRRTNNRATYQHGYFLRACSMRSAAKAIRPFLSSCYAACATALLVTPLRVHSAFALLLCTSRWCRLPVALSRHAGSNMLFFCTCLL